MATLYATMKTLSRDDLEALWERWYHGNDPDVAQLTDGEILNLFATCLALMDAAEQEQR